jgi:hypothetical protein
MLKKMDTLRGLFARAPNGWRATWRLALMAVGLVLAQYIIEDNLAIREAFGKLKMSPDLVDTVALFVDTERGLPILLIITLLVWVMGFARLAKLGVYMHATGLALTIIASVITLLITLAYRDEDVWGLLWDAVLVWLGNVFIFASLYWLIDAPHAQLKDHPQDKFEFLFPQRAADLPGWQNWQPRFFDYLFLAFATGTAFSPTETAPLSRRAKMLMMTQAAISLTVIAVLAARGINILKPPAS